MVWHNFQNLKTPQEIEERLKKRYSVTSDILSFQRCPRQYGFFAVRNYIPAHTAQMYYGIIIHQVLNKAHNHYKGLNDPTTKGTIPSDEDIKRYFQEVHNALWLHNIRPFMRNGKDADAAKRRLKIFNQREGPALYPRVRDTEHRLQSDRGDFILHGTVDVLADDPEWTPGQRAEIWDYKGGSCPDRNSEPFRRYEFQMLVYGELYNIRNQVYPTRGVLYFLGDIEDPDSNPIVEVNMNAKRINEALFQFEETVQKIEECRHNNRWPSPIGEEVPDRKTCDACDFRWDCTAARDNYPIRYP